MRGKGKDILNGENGVSKDSEVGKRASQAGEDQITGWGLTICIMKGGIV